MLSGAGHTLLRGLPPITGPRACDPRVVPGSEVPNDFSEMMERQPDLQRVLFNGRKAAEMFSRLVVPEAYWPDLGVTLRVLPSTSPANASVRLEALRMVWAETLRGGRS